MSSNSFTKIPFNKAELAGKEFAYIEESIAKGVISGEGSFVKKCEQFLEKYFLNESKVLLTPSCTSALEMCSILLNIKPGDEVIMPSFTFVSTASAVALLGGQPIFADVDSDTLNIDPKHVEKLITKNTKAITIVHYGGLACEISSLLSLCKKNKIALIEDAAHALDSYENKKPLGSFGDLATFSFHETKNVTCGEGGALIVNNPDLIEKAQIIQNKGTNRIAFQRGDAEFYSWVGLGSSYVMSDILAAFLYAQLENMQTVTKRRQNAKKRYEENLSNLMMRNKLTYRKETDQNNPSCHLFFILLNSKNEREELRTYLLSKGITAVFHYQPLHNSTYVKERWGIQPQLEHTERIADQLLRLPLFNSISSEKIDYICEEIENFFNMS
jgi:dTDP-4-amino-4,6-dideoxygalactose transaminase